jgi:hypothetical protein
MTRQYCDQGYRVKVGAREASAAPSGFRKATFRRVAVELYLSALCC